MASIYDNPRLSVGQLRELLAAYPDAMQVVLGSREGWRYPTTVEMQPMRTDSAEPHVNYFPDVPLDSDEAPDVPMVTIA
jgi:hypothetical protein